MHILGRRPAVAVFAAAVCATALLLTACTSSGNPAPKVPSTLAIGLLVSTTGPNAAIGQQAQLGAKLAIELVNNDVKDLPINLPLSTGVGLRNGAKLTLVVGNTDSAPEKVEKEASRLVQDGAVGLVLADTLDVAAPAGRETDTIGVALVDALSTADTFVDLNRAAHFRIQPSDRQMVSTALALLYRERDSTSQFNRVITASGKASGATGDEIASVRTSIEDLSLAAGYEIGGKEQIALNADGAGDSDFIEKGDAVLAIVTNAQEAAAASELAGRLKGKAPVIALGPGVGALDAIKGNNQVLRASGWSGEFAGRNPIARIVGGMFEQAFHAKMTDVAAAAFTATMLLALAMDSVTDLSPPVVRNAVQQLSLPATQTVMPWNGIRFDGSGYNQLAAGVIEQHVPNGYQVIHPIELAATPTLSL
ncbi:ABC transporter substrate-binding protein [Dactylosporangium sp. NBC_01737]|uniref:ABC transporter substrate-binding protein n=1 Tax=Dactylosporangium sp. NBC_01737 TaxID=2975959 RepID=UPI002E1007B7|nr:ABC transporter substrate-binding protein [Dactylosporangium sp. NBC_01737]